MYVDINTKESLTSMAISTMAQPLSVSQRAIQRIAQTSAWAGSRRSVERIFRQRIARTLSIFGLPSSDEVQTLAKQVTKLGRDVGQIDRVLLQKLGERTMALEQSTATLTQLGATLEQTNALASLAALIPAIAHDICTPVGNSNLAASVLRESLTTLRTKFDSGQLQKRDLDEFLSHYDQGLSMIETAGARISDLSQSLKHLSVDHVSKRLRRFAMDDLGAEVLTTLGPTLRKTSIRVEKDIDPSIQMNSYPGALGQVLINLLQNAMIHAFVGRVGGSIRIKATMFGADRVRIEVADDGVGMSPSARDKVFTPFFTTRAAEGGSGVGLSYSKRLVETELGGSIVLAPAAGPGTCFVINLPLEAAMRSPTALPSQHT